MMTKKTILRVLKKIAFAGGALSISFISYGVRLHDAAYRGDMEKVVGICMLSAYQLKNCEKVDVMEKNIHGHTALHLASLRGHEEVAGYLARFAPKLLWQEDNNGCSALELAIRHKQYSVVCALLKEISIAVRRGDVFIQHADQISSTIDYNFLPVVEQLKDPNTNKAQEEDIIKAFLRMIVDVDHRLKEAFIYLQNLVPHYIIWHPDDRP